MRLLGKAFAAILILIEDFRELNCAEQFGQNVKFNFEKPHKNENDTQFSYFPILAQLTGGVTHSSVMSKFDSNRRNP